MQARSNRTVSSLSSSTRFVKCTLRLASDAFALSHVCDLRCNVEGFLKTLGHFFHLAFFGSHLLLVERFIFSATKNAHRLNVYIKINRPKEEASKSDRSLDCLCQLIDAWQVFGERFVASENRVRECHDGLISLLASGDELLDYAPLLSTTCGQYRDAFVCECDLRAQFVNVALVDWGGAVAEEEPHQARFIHFAANTGDTRRRRRHSRPASVRCMLRGRRGHNGSQISHRSTRNSPCKLNNALRFHFVFCSLINIQLKLNITYIYIFVIRFGQKRVQSRCIIDQAVWIWPRKIYANVRKEKAIILCTVVFLFSAPLNYLGFWYLTIFTCFDQRSSYDAHFINYCCFCSPILKLHCSF